MTNESPGSERELIIRIRMDDPDAVTQVYRSAFYSIVHFILQNNGSEQEAKDIYQEAFLVFYEKIKEDPGFELTCKIKTYLYSVSRRLWLKRLHEKNRLQGDIQDYEEYVALDQAELEDWDEREKRIRLMQEALKKLGERCRQIILSFYVQKKSMQDIAREMAYTNPANAKNQKYKCLQRLKKLFFKHYKPEELLKELTTINDKNP